MPREFCSTPRAVPPVQTRFRRIRTPLPAPDSLPVLERLRRYEPAALSGQPPIVWDRAEGAQVFDRWGNCWLDWSSGVLITNAGHGHPEIAAAIRAQADSGLLTNYCFPSEPRARLVERLAGLLPDPLKKIFLLTTGSETTECAIKLARTHGRRVGGTDKITIVSYEDAFHGRTFGAQLAGGIPALKEWITRPDPTFVQAPFPDGFRTPDTSFPSFERSLAAQGVRPEQVAGVMMESYQGGSAAFAPPEYVRELAEWCRRHQVVLIFDEVQAGFGRTGTMFGFEHYGVVPDLTCLGKGISSSLPLAAVAGRPELMDQYPPGSMTSTHTGNPVCVAAALASMEVIERDDLAGNAARVGRVLHEELNTIAGDFPQVGAVHGRGLVAGLPMVKPGTKEPDADLAWDIVQRCYEKGLLMFSPVGFGGATVKIAPPLVTTAEMAVEAAGVLREAIAEAVGAVPAGAAARKEPA